MNLSKYWGAVALRGFCTVLFGLAALFWPRLTITLLVFWVGAYFLVDGIFSIAGAFQAASSHKKWWMLLLEGIVGIGAGAVTLLWPHTTAFILVIIIAAWAIMTGVFEVGAAITAPWPISNRWLLAFGGLLSILFGILVFAYPASGLLTIIWIIGVYAVAFGMILIILGFRLRSQTAVASV